MSWTTRPTPSPGRKARANAFRTRSIPLRWMVPPTNRNRNSGPGGGGISSSPGREGLRVDPQRHDVDPVRRQSGVEVDVADGPAVGPDLVRAERRRQPGPGQAAVLPRLEERPPPRRRRLEPWRPAVRHPGVRRPSRRHPAAPGLGAGSGASRSGVTAEPLGHQAQVDPAAWTRARQSAPVDPAPASAARRHPPPRRAAVDHPPRRPVPASRPCGETPPSSPRRARQARRTWRPRSPRVP